MKKISLLICAILLMSGTVFSQNFDFGFGATAGTKMKLTETDFTTGYGAHVRGVFNFLHKFAIQGGASYFLPSKFTDNGSEIKNHFMVFNADFVFNFVNVAKVKVYGFAGLAFTTQYYNKAGDKVNTSNTGLEAGAGLRTGPLFVEAKYDFKHKQMMATLGIYIK